MNNLKIEEQCPKGILCKENEHCESKHYRCFAGICVEGRKKDQKNGNCGNDQCKLLHLSLKDYKNELNIQPINGIYRFNICKEIECKQQKVCRFIHPQWAKSLCYEYIMDNCVDETHKNHSSWNDIRAKVYEEYNKKLKMNCNPEEKLEEQSNYFKENKICMNYLQGLCEKKNGLCAQQHIFWEELITIAYNMKKTLRSCIEENNSKNFKSLDKYQSQSLLMNEDELKRLQNAVKEQNIIDLIIIMDFTGSMVGWMDACKSQIKGIIETFQKSIKNQTLQIGVVGYRDIKDEQKIVFHELTSNIDMITTFIAKQKAEVGGDTTEDVCAGIEKAMTLNISKHVDSLLITILFADVPCHGKQYHDLASDDLADKVPPNTLENLMKRYYNMKNNNFFTCVNITTLTKKMFEVMKENFPDLFISEPSKINQFENLVRLTLRQSLTATLSLKKEQYKAEFRKFKLSEQEITQKDHKNQFWRNFQEQLLQMKREGETVLEFQEKQLLKEEEQQGQKSVVYKFFDVINNQQNEIIDTLKQKYESDAEVRYLNQARARQLAFIFRERTSGIVGVPPIFFPMPIIYSLKDNKFLGLTKIYGEVYIDLPQAQWKKYSTNGTYLDEESYYYSVFSHFVFEETQKWFTITDLQGKRNLLSDPAVQTAKNFKDNLMIQLISKTKELETLHFYINNALGLESLPNSQEINQKQWKIEKDDKIDAFCENCDTQIELTQEEYREKKYKMCESCRASNSNIENILCKCCKYMFEIQLNEKFLRGTNVNICNSCNINCQMRSNKSCAYCGMSCIQFLLDKLIGGKTITICKKGIAYLETLECLHCKHVYDFSIVLKKANYYKGVFYCGGEKCRK